MGNGIHGIRTSGFALVEGCIARGNASHGFDTTRQSNVINCLSQGNGNGGILHSGGLIAMFMALENVGEGIKTTGSTVVNSVAQDNGGDGMEVGVVTASHVAQCTSKGNGALEYDLQNMSSISDSQ